MPINRTSINAVKVSTFLVDIKASIAWLKTVTTKELLAENVYLTGFTRFNSLSVILAFFICGMIEHDAAVLLGYKRSYKALRIGKAVAFRMRMITKEIDSRFYQAFYILHKAGHIKDSLAWLLDPERNKRKVYGKNRRNISVNICETIVARNHGDRDQAALHTGVPVSTIDFWRNLGYKA